MHETNKHKHDFNTELFLIIRNRKLEEQICFGVVRSRCSARNLTLKDQRNIISTYMHRLNNGSSLQMGLRATGHVFAAL